MTSSGWSRTVGKFQESADCVSVHWSLFRSGLASVHCLLIHKEGSELPSQADWGGDFQPVYTPIFVHKGVCQLLGSPHFARTPIRTSVARSIIFLVGLPMIFWSMLLLLRKMILHCLRIFFTDGWSWGQGFKSWPGHKSANQTQHLLGITYR